MFHTIPRCSRIYFSLTWFNVNKEQTYKHDTLNKTKVRLKFVGIWWILQHQYRRSARWLFHFWSHQLNFWQYLASSISLWWSSLISTNWIWLQIANKDQLQGVITIFSFLGLPLHRNLEGLVLVSKQDCCFTELLWILYPNNRWLTKTQKFLFCVLFYDVEGCSFIWFAKAANSRWFRL